MDVSAVVLSFNSLRYIQTCVESLMNSYAECGVQGDVFVVDNGSVDGSVQALKSLQDRFGESLHVEYLQHNTGTTRSRNLALRQCTGQSVLILDSDAYMNAPALKDLLAYQAEHPEVGLVAPKLTYPDGRFQLSVDVFPTVVRKFERLLSLRSMEQRGIPAETGPVDYAISACWMLSRRAITATGLLDERIFYSPEDVDYCIRLWKSGLVPFLVDGLCHLVVDLALSVVIDKAGIEHVHHAAAAILIGHGWDKALLGFGAGNADDGRVSGARRRVAASASYEGHGESRRAADSGLSLIHI